jgi:hypothetical protein
MIASEVIRMNRKEFLYRMRRLLLAAAAIPKSLGADDSLHILPQNSIERLRLDFNASRTKVRLLFLLSPT